MAREPRPGGEGRIAPSPRFLTGSSLPHPDRPDRSVHEEIPDRSLFMMCRVLERRALRELPDGYRFRTCRRDELELWMAMPFDTPEDAAEHRGFMEDFFERVYAPHGDLFFRRCLFACDARDRPVGTGFHWTIHGDMTTFHWLKVAPAAEGRGLGRAILSRVLGSLEPADFPVYLHTHPSSYRAVKLYSDFGFDLLSDPRIGTRPNHLEECLPLLRQVMPPAAFESLRITEAPAGLHRSLEAEVEPEF